MKYIIVKDREDKEHGIIFPDAITHKEVARIHRASDIRVISAGFCQFVEGGMAAWGRSESLGMQGRSQDAEILTADLCVK